MYVLLSKIIVMNYCSGRPNKKETKELQYFFFILVYTFLVYINLKTFFRYLFTVTLYSQDMNVSVTSTPALVNVVPGNPPLIKIPYIPMLHDPDSGINIPAYVTDITHGCQLTWSSVFETAFEYLDLKQLVSIFC